MSDLATFLKEQSAGGLLPWRIQMSAAERYGVSPAVVEEEALELEILPARYQRNRQVISTANQLTLFRSHVAVIGCGGLGGHIIEQLARLGVGHLTVIDPDTFEEHNLNRQILSSPLTLGLAKVEAAAARVREINPAVSVTPVRKALTRENGKGLLQGCTL
ncbi:MAG TPA: ThiF family adenylyltransferase, partial [Verrucomicrobiae bacterium]|nr:ThiF family adenylyltransferase [Verrucomicrobiae bacterium]